MVSLGCSAALIAAGNKDCSRVAVRSGFMMRLPFGVIVVGA